MRSQLRRLMLSLFAIAAIAFAGSFAAGHTVAVADQCTQTNGGNWDNSLSC
jgi:hypothetical protein